MMGFRRFSLEINEAIRRKKNIYLTLIISLVIRNDLVTKIMEVKLEACQANLVYKFRNIKTKLMKTNLHIKFNKGCLNLDHVCQNKSQE